jgi:hypothetical protein
MSPSATSPPTTAPATTAPTKSPKKKGKAALEQTPAPTTTSGRFLKDISPDEWKGLRSDRCKCVYCQEDKECGGLWYGDEPNGDAHKIVSKQTIREIFRPPFPAIPQLSSRLIKQKKIKVVVSHCLSDLGWLSTFLAESTSQGVEADITIISKCDGPVIGAPENVKVIRLPNVGRCDHSYAYFASRVIGTEDDDDVAVLFLKDDMSNANLHQIGFWRSLPEMLDIVSVRGFACGVEPSKFRVEENHVLSLSLYHNWEHLSQFSLEEYGRKKEGYESQSDEFQSRFSNLGDFASQVLDKAHIPDKLIPVCYGGVFAGKMSNIKRQDPSVWANLERALSRGNNIEEGHFSGTCWMATGPPLSQNMFPNPQSLTLMPQSDCGLV